MNSLLRYLIGSLLIAEVVFSVVVNGQAVGENTCSTLCQAIHVANIETDEKIAETEKEIASLRVSLSVNCVNPSSKNIVDKLAAIKKEVADIRAGFICSNCTEGWSQLGDTCYIYQSEKVHCDTAQERCIVLGGDLAKPSSMVKDEFLIALLNKTGGTGHGPWFGALKKNGKFVWAKTGEALTYFNWNEGEPNGVPADGFGIHYHYIERPKWNDAICGHYNFPFLCEKPAVWQ